MIQSATLKQLSIILPNTNKALSQVLNDLGTKETTTLTQSKDLKSIINTLFKESSQNKTQDKALLELVKNNPTLKNLGNVSKDIKELLNLIKTQKSLQTKTDSKQATPQKQTDLEKTLESVLSNVKDIQQSDVKTKIQNSGIFLESTLKNTKPPLENLKNTLTQLSKSLDNTQLPQLKELNAQIKNILSSDFFKNTNTQDIKLLTDLTQEIKKPMQSIQKTLDSSFDKTLSPKDTVFTKEFKAVFDKVQLLNKPQELQNATQTKEQLSHDLKATLLKSHEEVTNSNNPQKQEILKAIDKLTLQIDYHQLVSHLSNSSSLYIPYTWDQLEDGSITLKSAKNKKFFCDIELQLKDYGELKLRLGMFEKNQLSINIDTKNEEFRALLKQNIGSLKEQLFSVGIYPQNIHFIEEKTTPTDAYNEYGKNLKMGFEVKA
jgi:hypothetical protein